MSIFHKNEWQNLRAEWQRSFLVTFVFVTLAALLFWLDGFRAYQADMQILVIGKTPAAATNQVVENFTELSKNLSFYERVLSGNDLIDDDFEGYSQDERKAHWQEIVTVTQSAGSGMLLISATQDTSEKATRLSEETVRALFAMASFYYNIKTDIDLRVVDGVIVKTVIAHPVRYVATSVVSAFGVTTVFFLTLATVPGLLGRRRMVRPVSQTEIESVPFLDPQKFVPARPTTLHFEGTPTETRAGEEKMKGSHGGSDRLLPGMEATELPFQFEETYPEEAALTNLPLSGGFLDERVDVPASEVSVEPVKQGEPTVEEYKRRLNELLAGGK
ncbi:MAG: hypothetical protein KBA91_00740 [Candidatus Moranbacteria bacterium]|nr:hypothetical protein [Candidatus Moranbacteria bacterium]